LAHFLHFFDSLVKNERLFVFHEKIMPQFTVGVIAQVLAEERAKN